MSEVAFGAEISEDRSSCAVAKAWRQPDGRVAVKVVWRGSPLTAPDVLDALYVSDEPVDTAIDPKSQSATLCAKVAERGVPVRRLGPEDVAVAHGEFMDLLASGGLKQFGQPELTAAVRAAQARPLAGALALERRKVGVDQSPLTASEFAVWVLQRWEETSNPGVYAI